MNKKLKDLEEAIEKSADILDIEYWKLETIISIARLVLNNNYIETSSGIFKLDDCLAMGNKASAAGLNLVGLVREFELFVQNK